MSKEEGSNLVRNLHLLYSSKNWKSEVAEELTIDSS